MKISPLFLACAFAACSDTEKRDTDAAPNDGHDPAPIDSADGIPDSAPEDTAADTSDTHNTADLADTVETTDTTGDSDSTDSAETTDAADTTPHGTWDPGDDRVTFVGACDELGFTCSGGALLDCECVRDATGKCLSRESYRVDCPRIYPDAATCASIDDEAMCAVLPGGRCLFTLDELGLPEANPLYTEWIEFEHDAAGIVAPCAGDRAGCVIEADGVGRCRETLPECSYPGTDPELPSAGECNRVGTLEVITCSDEERRADRTTLARDCPADTCGITCAGLPDGAPCTFATTRGTGHYFWGGAGFGSEPPSVCGPFSRCDATEICTPRICEVGGTGACTNTPDCAALAVGLPTAFETLLDCIAGTGTSDPSAWSTCLREIIPVSPACAACFTDLDGDFETCAGF